MFALGKIAVAALACSAITFGQNASSGSTRQEALALYNANKFAQALPLLEHLATENTSDLVVQERLGMSAWATRAGETDTAKRLSLCKEARAAFLKAKELGDNSNLLQNVLPSIPENCEETTLSANKDVNDIMRSAESAFSRGDFDGALRGYQQALTLDPKLYSAALFSGDVYFKQGNQERAGEWYARAIQIDPNVETAYRYWGDALMAQGKFTEAREHFIEAVVAQPYIRRSWTGIMQWAQRNKLQLKQVEIRSASSFTVDAKGQNNITIDPKALDNKAGGAAWIGYGMRRALDRTETFPKKHPGEKYRQSLQEETEALTSVATIAEELRT
ncbi:MAG: tetratricopeptide repeat protein, partial [Terriglobales bacterium]